MPPQPSPSSNLYSHSIQPQPMHSKSANNTNNTIECPFLQLPETIQFSKMLDDPEGFRAVTPTNSFDSWDTTSTCQTMRQRTLFIIWSGRQAIIDTGIVLDIPLDLPKHIRIAAMVKDKSSVVTRHQLAVEARCHRSHVQRIRQVVVRKQGATRLCFWTGDETGTNCVSIALVSDVSASRVHYGSVLHRYGGTRNTGFGGGRV
ncbi:hypothetical protein CEXT_600861 [Caerostris extrusa]|uniref:Uncharacterized protein n=1 Tax=Caerostris extrusa TaxID=172846 RepID=A0AAV4W525_CAEEX|nr:hypothetical protein CEXT_600861 [Caerostris extrusa]